MSWEKELSRRIKSINARITTVGNIYGFDSAIYRRIIDTVKKAGGNTRFAKKMFDGGLRQLSKAEHALIAVENSQYTSRAGRKAIGNKARETFAVNHSDYDDIALSKMYELFKNSSFARLDEIFKGSSELVVDAIMTAFETDEPSVRKMNNKIDYFVKHLNDFDVRSGDDIEIFRNWLER